MTDFDWTAEIVELIISARSEGKTAREIGELLGVTRNAVIGKWARLRLPKKKTGPPKRKAQPKREPKPKTIVVRAVPMPPPVVVRKPAMGVSAAVEALESLDCRWPFGDPHSEDFHFCGARVRTDKDGMSLGPYCAEHMDIARGAPVRISTRPSRR